MLIREVADRLHLRRLVGGGALLLVAVVAASCGSSSSKTPTPVPGTPTQTTSGVVGSSHSRAPAFARFVPANAIAYGDWTNAPGSALITQLGKQAYAGGGVYYGVLPISEHLSMEGSYIAAGALFTFARTSAGISPTQGFAILPGGGFMSLFAVTNLAAAERGAVKALGVKPDGMRDGFHLFGGGGQTAAISPTLEIDIYSPKTPVATALENVIEVGKGKLASLASDTTFVHELESAPANYVVRSWARAGALPVALAPSPPLSQAPFTLASALLGGGDIVFSTVVNGRHLRTEFDGFGHGSLAAAKPTVSRDAFVTAAQNTIVAASVGGVGAAISPTLQALDADLQGALPFSLASVAQLLTHGGTVTYGPLGLQFSFAPANVEQGATFLRGLSGSPAISGILLGDGELDVLSATSTVSVSAQIPGRPTAPPTGPTAKLLRDLGAPDTVAAILYADVAAVAAERKAADDQHEYKKSWLDSVDTAVVWLSTSATHPQLVINLAVR